MSLPLCLWSQVSFEPVGKVTHVFFDDRNHQVFSVRSGGATGTMVRGFDGRLNSTFRLDDRGDVVTIKLSPDQTTLAVQRSKTDVELLAVERAAGVTLGTMVMAGTTKKCSQSCKTKGAVMLGFSWLSDGAELVLVTDHGIEIYGLMREREARSLRMIRSHSQAISWYCLCPHSQVIVCAAATTVQTLHVAIIRGGYVYKLQRLDLDGHEVRERDVVVCDLYGRTYVAVFIHPKRGSRKEGEEVHLFRVSSKRQSIDKAFVFKLPEECSGGGMALNCMDDLFFIHCQSLKKTFLFDVCSVGDSDGSVTYLGPVATGAIEEKQRQGAAAVLPTSTGGTRSLEYSSSWVTFQPDIIVDAKEGFMWRVKVVLSDTGRLSAAIPDPTSLISFLKRREGAKSVLLEALLRFSMDTSTRVKTVGELLDQINAEYHLHVEEQLQQQMALPASASASAFSSAKQAIKQTLSPISPAEPFPQGSPQQSFQNPDRNRFPVAKVVIDQADLYASLFSPMLESGNVCQKRLVAIMMEYYRSLEMHHIQAQHFLSELLINLLVTSRQWFQLHVLLQYRVIPDSKPLACLLLSLESAYLPALQLATDMLYRLRNSAEEICEVLLSKGLVVLAVRFAAENNLDHIPVRKFLEAALHDGDESVFFNVFQHFEKRNVIPQACYREFLQVYQKKSATAKAEQRENAVP